MRLTFSLLLVAIMATAAGAANQWYVSPTGDDFNDGTTIATAWKTIDQDYHWHLKIRPRLKVLNGLKETGRFHLNPILPEDAARTLAALC